MDTADETRPLLAQDQPPPLTSYTTTQRPDLEEPDGTDRTESDVPPEAAHDTDGKHKVRMLTIVRRVLRFRDFIF